MTRRAFSLLELLIVVAIIALLVSITAPSLTRSFALARRTICTNNLSKLMQLTLISNQGKRISGQISLADPMFMKQEFWPNRPAAEVRGAKNRASRLFLCPDGLSSHGYGDPPLEYWSAISLDVMPFDPTSFHCDVRRGEEGGKPYTEYVIEENPYVKSKWNHQSCCGVASWSTNDGIWRIYDEAEDGLRTIVLTYYDCGWANELWVNGEFYWDNLSGHVGEVLKFKDVVTNYGYNGALGESAIVSPDTVVLMDFNYLHIDATAPGVTADLNSLDTARHFGKANVAYASGAVMAVGPADLYPDIDDSPWTPDAD